MAVSLNDRIIRAVATASQTVFTYDFPITAVTDIEIQVVNGTTGVATTLVYSTNYTLTGVGADGGGTFILTSGATANDIYVAYGVTPLARATDFSGNTDVTTAALNTDYNEEEKQIQQLGTDIDRCLRLPITDNFTALAPELPVVGDRKGKYLYFNATTGAAEMADGTSETSPAGGSNTQIQYNNAGSLGGDSGFTTNGTGTLTLTGTLTTTGSITTDNIKIDGNTISSTNANGNVSITPNGTGILDLSASTEAMKFPVGTTAQRPSAPTAGYARFNTTVSAQETYDGSTWIAQFGGSGDVDGPGSSTDNAAVRFDGTGGTLIQNSGVLISDLDAITGVTALTVDNLNLDLNTIISTNANGNINITPNGTGDLVLDGLKWPQADGTANQVIKTNGSGQLSFTNNNNTWALLSSQSASASASINFSGLLTTAYSYYKIIITHVVPATDGAIFYCRTDSNGGASYDSGASDYIYAVNFISTAPAASQLGSGGASQIIFTGTVGSTPNEHLTFEVSILDPTSATLYATINWHGMFYSDAGIWYRVVGTGQRASNSVDSIQFLFSSGNIASGDFKLYGLVSS